MSTIVSSAPLESSKAPGWLASRLPFYYGWAILPVAMLAQVCSSPGQTYGISKFNESFQTTLGISSSQLSGAYMLGTLLGCLPLTYFGGLIDRNGMRRSMAAVSLLLGGACMFASQVQGLTSLFFAFLFLRMIGQGALTLLATNTLAMWFHARLGLANGVMSLGMATAMGMLPRQLDWLIVHVGWRETFVIQGLFVWAVMLPLVAIVYRDRPEEVGQKPKEILPTDEKPTQPSTCLASFNLNQALRTRTYWIMLIATASWAMIGTAIFFHLSALLGSRGLSRQTGSDIFTTFAICMAIMNFSGGLLADRIPLHLLIATALIAMTVALGVGITMDTHLKTQIFAIFFGSGQGLLGVTINTMWPRYFGRKHLGRIRGSIWMTTVAGSSVGPFFMGFIADSQGSFTPALWAFFAILAPLSALALFATPPGEPKSSPAMG